MPLDHLAESAPVFNGAWAAAVAALSAVTLAKSIEAGHDITAEPFLLITTVRRQK